MSRPVVAHLLPNYNPFPPIYPAGTELRVEQVSFRQQRYRPVVICGAFHDQPVTEERGAMGIRRIRIGRLYRRLFHKMTRLDPWPYTARMWEIARKEGAGLLHIHNEPKLLAGLARALARQPVPVIVHIANEKPFAPGTIHLVTRWVACSNYMAGWLTQQYGISASAVQVIYTGVNTADREPWWELKPGRRTELRRRFGVENDEEVVILFAGRIVKEKGLAELLEAFRIVRSRTDRPVSLLIAGNIRESKDPNNIKAVYGKAMLDRIARQDGARWVGSLSPHEMHDFLAAGDLFVLPSTWDDPFPTVMLEAAAAGIPVLGSAKGGIIEFLGDCPGLPLIESPESPETWCGLLETMINDAGLRHSTGRFLRGKAEKDFDWRRVAAEFEALYDDILPGTAAESALTGAK